MTAASTLSTAPDSPGLFQALESGTQWPTNKTSVNITYTFWQNTPAYDTVPAENDQFEPFTATMIAATQACLAYISEISNITFQQVTDPGTGDEAGQAAIQIGYGMAVITPQAEAYTYYPSATQPNGGDVWANETYFTVDSNFNPDPTALHVVPGNYDWMTIWHETGHALGLKHPFKEPHSTDPHFYLPTALDTHQYSIMSYTHSPNYQWSDGTGFHEVFPETYMPYDIAAIQALYGVNTTYNTGNNDYVLNPDHVYTIWDAGGSDTMDGSALGTNEIINLQQGGYSTINENTPITQNIAIAFGTVIEDAIGGSGNDTIYDNSADNYIQGGAGNDTIYLSTGHDTVSGGLGDDTMVAGIGNETLDGGAGNDTVIFGVATSSLVFDDTTDTATMNGNTYTLLNDETYQFTDGTFTSFSDQVITGTASNDVLKGALGNDTITGGAGADTLYGYGGNDTIDGGAGADKMYGGSGNDTYFVDNTGDVTTDVAGAAGGIDTVISSVSRTLGAYLENLTLVDVPGQPLVSAQNNLSGTGNTLNNVIIGNDGNNVLNGSTGNDTLDGGAGADKLTGGTGADTFVFHAATAFSGVDTITDFSPSQSDKIDISNVLTDYTSGSLTGFVELTSTKTATILSVDPTGGGHFTAIAILSNFHTTTVDSLVADGNLIV